MHLPGPLSRRPTRHALLAGTLAFATFLYAHAALAPSPSTSTCSPSAAMAVGPRVGTGQRGVAVPRSPATPSLRSGDRVDVIAGATTVAREATVVRADGDGATLAVRIAEAGAVVAAVNARSVSLVLLPGGPG